MNTRLRWIEYALLGIGLALSGWSVLAWTESQYYKSLPVPALRVLPGERESRQPDAGTPIARGSWVARLEAPSIGLVATVLEGSDDATLARAAGHIETTALPGTAGNVGIAGHRDTTFRPVRRLAIGDRLILTTAAASFEYRVSATTIVEPEDVHVLDPTAQPTLTLVTCYPFTFIGHAPKRFIVKAERVGVAAARDEGR